MSMWERYNYQPELPGFAEHEQDVFMFEHLPYSDFRTGIPENTIYEKACVNIPALYRLADVKALSILSYIGPKPEDTYFFEFNHNRFDHSLTVALIMEQILQRNGLPQEQVDLGIIAGLLHDIATPANGDATKQIDMVNLHEEDHWWKALDKEGKDFIAQYANIKTFDGIIKNQGLLGKALDVADRITYTMKDLNAIHSQLFPLGMISNIYLASLNTIINDHQDIGNIYKEVGVDYKRQDVFFNNPKTLRVFLELRAHLHKNLYLYPTNQAKDLFFAKALSPLYSADGSSPLSPDRLRLMTDHDLMAVLSDYYKQPVAYMRSPLTNWYPEFEKFESWDEARKREIELKQQDNIVVVGIKECKGFDPATSYKVADGYKYKEFREVDPESAYQIEKTAKSTKGIFLFWSDLSPDLPSTPLLKAVLQKQ